MPLKKLALLEETRQAEVAAQIIADKEPIAGGWMTFDGPGSWANQACGLGLSSPVSAEEIDRLIEFYETRKVEPRIELSPFADESLIRGLGEAGFRLIEFENVLFRQMCPEDTWEHPYGWPEGLEIKQVDSSDAAQVKSFADVSTSGFRKKGEPLSPAMEASVCSFIRHPATESFFAVIDGKKVGGGAAEMTETIASFFGTSVLPDYRRRGVQLALMLHRLQRAQQNGCQFACIHSRPGIATESNAMRLGFSVGYTRVILTRPGPGLTPSP